MNEIEKKFEEWNRLNGNMSQNNDNYGITRHGFIQGHNSRDKEVKRLEALNKRLAECVVEEDELNEKLREALEWATRVIENNIGFPMHRNDSLPNRAKEIRKEFGLDIVVDETMPKDEAHFKINGKTVGKITNIGND